MSISGFYEGWRDLMDNKSDPRTNDWFLMSSPFPTIAISLTYAYCVKVGSVLGIDGRQTMLNKIIHKWE